MLNLLERADEAKLNAVIGFSQNYSKDTGQQY